jgi:ketosteroid isomerase-like protein
MLFSAQTASASAPARQQEPDQLSQALEPASGAIPSGTNPLAPQGISDEEWQGITSQIASNDPITYLKASNTDGGDEFGYSVAISGDTIVVGAYEEDSSATGVNGNQQDNSANGAGAAYVFTRDRQGSWSQQAYLKASNTDAEDSFGRSVAISGDTIVVGAYGEASSATGVNGNQQDDSAPNAGAAYVFRRDGQGSWSQQAYLKASNTDAADLFGSSVAISGDTIVVGAWKEDSSATGVNGNQQDNSATDSGAAYVFTRDSQGSWSQQAYLKASNTDVKDFFGFGIAISGDTIVVGAYGEDSSATGVNGNQQDNSASYAGAAYVFRRDSQGSWSQQAYLKASNTDEQDQFGESVAISGDTIVVGAEWEASSATGVDGNQQDNSASHAGAAYVFTRDSQGSWSQQAYLKASNTDTQDYFGFGIAISGDTIVVGAYGEASSATGVNGNQQDNSAWRAGAAYVFRRDGQGSWSQQAYLKASNTYTQDYFGWSIAISGDTIVVGAWAEDSSATGVNGDQQDNSAMNAGAAYVYTLPFEETGDWLIMYYMAGDNNLEYEIYLEISEIIKLRQSNVDIAIFYDSIGSGTYYQFYDNGGPQEYIEKPNLNSGDGATLSDFVLWAKSKSDAPKQALVIADHGHGLRGVAWDDRENGDNISVNNELRSALISAGPVDVLYSHSCLTANLEFMWELRGLTKYYIASESVSYTTSHNYLNYIGQSTNAETLSKKIAESYYSLKNHKHPSTISVVNMDYIEEIFTATHDLALAIRQAPLSVKIGIWNQLDYKILQRFYERSKGGRYQDY